MSEPRSDHCLWPNDVWDYGGCSLVVDYAVRDLCTHPYPGHPHGCPNHGKRATCPPMAPRIDTFLRLDMPTTVVWSRFDLAAHAERMLARHPGWSDRQARCCLYWQGTARKRLRKALRLCLANEQAKYPRYRVVSTLCPEAMGVNVTATMERLGIVLEWPPRHWTYQVAVLGLQKPEGESDE